MSYSFGIREATKALAILAVMTKMEETARDQPVHAADKQQAIESATAFINVLPDDDTMDVSVTMSGSLAGVWEGNTITRISGSAVSVYANLVTRVVQP